MGVAAVVAPTLRAAAAAARRGTSRGDGGMGSASHDGHGEDAGRGGSGGSSAMTHAWLFTGPPGSGRSNAAVAFAAALECTNPHIIGCGTCEQCRKVQRGAHTDVVHITPRELTIGVETMRTEVVTPAAMLPT
ncbi:MAG: hypothetical protein ACFNWU_06920, partial [Corynebacterium matruchotii]